MLLELHDAALILRHQSRSHRARSKRIVHLLEGKWEFLNDGTELGFPPDWSTPGKSRLWAFHLHYFDDLPDLSTELPDAHQTVFALIDSWSANNPLNGPKAAWAAWHPYTVSLRMVNWMISLSAVVDASRIPQGIRRVLEQHAIFLERNLEVDNGGNHLLKNLKAMTFAGCFWTGVRAEEWRTKYGQWFIAELERQLLADGGHYERSPMYHSQVLADAIEVDALLSRNGCFSSRLRQLVDRMNAFLPLVTHPDGEIALFNDSAFGMTPPPVELSDAVERLRGGRSTDRSLSNRFELLLSGLESRERDGLQRSTAKMSTNEQAAHASGYVVLPNDQPNRFLIADVGRVCPDDLPAHAHADLLSFELALNGRRIVVDSGVGEYAAGPWRQYYRSTAAHNTISVDGCEQSDCWGSFRVAQRAQPRAVDYFADQSRAVLSAEHTGFSSLSGHVRHRRRFVWSALDFWVVSDTLLGKGIHRWNSFCHFHPDVEIVDRHSTSVRVLRAGEILDIAWFGFEGADYVRGECEPLQGWYAERFGPAVPSTALILKGQGVLPAQCGFAIVPQPDLRSPSATVVSFSKDSIDVVTGRAQYRLDLLA